MASGKFQFEGFTLDVARSSLRTANREIELRPKSFEVLRFLVENADRVVTKEDVIQAVSPHVIVTDDVLPHCIREVRNALGDDQQSVIKTVPRRGYRFAAPVAPLSKSFAVPPPQAAAAVRALSRSSVDPERRAEPPLAERPSIAVLPFQNMSTDVEQEYFADGVVEEIITALPRFAGLFVMPRNSSFAYKGRAIDVKQIGLQLGVRYVLEGSVRRAMNRVRVTGQLIDASNGAHLWADRFDGALEDICRNHVTERMVSAIAPKLERSESEPCQT